MTTFGGSTDGTIRSITRGYDALGRLAKLTSHGNQTDDPDNTTDVKNRIVYTCNELGQTIKSVRVPSWAPAAAVEAKWFSSVSDFLRPGIRSLTVRDRLLDDDRRKHE